MSDRYHQECLSLYCYLPNEFFNANSQEPKKRKKSHRNTNAFNSSSPTRLFKCRRKNSNRRHKIMSIGPSDYATERHHSSQMADGDKNHGQMCKKSPEQRSIDDQPNTKRSRSSERETVKSFQDLISHLSLSRAEQSTFRVNRTSTWRKLHANITPTYYNQIQEFQREHQQKSKFTSVPIPRPIMLPPSNQRLEANPSEKFTTHSNETSSCISSSLLSNDSTPDSEILQSVSIEQQKTEENDEPSYQIKKQNDQSEMAFEENASIEEFQPTIEIISPSSLFDELFSSFFPSRNPCASLEKGTHRAEFFVIDQIPTSSLITPKTILDKQRSLPESIEELCLLIRKLLYSQTTERSVTSLQTTITNQLAILLTYLALSTNDKINSELSRKNTLEKMTSTDDSQKRLFSSIGTQTDFDSMIQQNNDQLLKFIQSFSDHSDFHHNSTDDHQSISLESDHEGMVNRIPSTKNTMSSTELLSNSKTLHLPGCRLHHALSDTFAYHTRHHQQYSSSCHRLISYSATTVHSLMFHRSRKERSSHLLKHLGEQFRHFVELESSNTCLEASTEFTPDFLLTTMNSSRNDQNDVDDQTEQFGIETEKEDLQMDTFTANSYVKDDCDSLEVDIELDLHPSNDALSNSIHFHQSNPYCNHESPLEDEDLLTSAVTEMSSLVSITPISESVNDNYLTNRLHFYQLLQPVFNSYQWQTPILPRQSNSTDLVFEKQAVKMEFKQLRIRSSSNNEMNLIGKRVRIKSNSAFESSTLTTKDYFQDPEQRSRLLTLNYNNNYSEYNNSTDSLDNDISSHSRVA